MTPGIQQPDIADVPMVGNRVHALAVRAVRALPGTRGPRSSSIRWPFPVPRDLLTREAESRWYVVFSSVGLGLIVDPIKVVVGGGPGLVLRVVLEPETELHVVAKQLWADLLVRIKQDPLVGATPEPTAIRGGAASGVLLRHQITERGRSAVFHKMPAVFSTSLAEVALDAHVAYAGGGPGGGQGDLRGPVGLVVGKDLGAADCCD
mmetsp:Transcript_58745/g.128743  ORF Transcript_58745/g.128743 Transcript_58745/m.128743 type:complete len:206 (-) Transcript_58745:1747-2364(-)